MVSVAVGVAGCEVRIDRYEDVGESQRQEDRRGTLAVESGPPMRGSGGVADRLRPLPVDTCGLPVYRPRSHYTPDPPRVERHSASRALFVCRRPAPGLLQGCRALRSPEPSQADSLPQPGRFLESTEAVLSLAGTGGGELIRHHH